MKKLSFVLFFIGVVFIQPLLAQQKASLSSVLTSYYHVKDALVGDDAKVAASSAAQLLKAIQGVDMASMAPKDHKAFMALEEKLAFDARHISESSDINHQREHFTSLSANMTKLAKEAHLSDQPVYEDYCPMKKAYWLSDGAEIRNPYFGKSMLSCGKVAATFKP